MPCAAVKGSHCRHYAEIYGRPGSTLDEYGVKFLDKMAKSDKPFFLYTALAAVTSITTQMRNMRVALGAHLLRRLHGGDERYLRQSDKALEKNGQLDNTLIVFTSDTVRKPKFRRTVARRSAVRKVYMGRRCSCANLRLLERHDPTRKSDGIVDLADLFPTALDLRGILGRK